MSSSPKVSTNRVRACAPCSGKTEGRVLRSRKLPLALPRSRRAAACQQAWGLYGMFHPVILRPHSRTPPPSCNPQQQQQQPSIHAFSGTAPELLDVMLFSIANPARPRANPSLCGRELTPYFGSAEPAVQRCVFEGEGAESWKRGVKEKGRFFCAHEVPLRSSSPTGC
eukprot:1142799-Pelagomonas_calceolata.AAC.5